MWDDATYWSDWDEGRGSQVHRTYLDVEKEVVSTPGLHHAFVELPDGTLAWGSQNHGGKEALVELAPGAAIGDIIWTCQDDWPGSGSCESNGLFYSPDRDTYLYSFYTNNSMVEVNRAEGTSRWWAGDVSGGFRFDPPESQFSWQHGVSWTDAGTVLLSTHARVGGRDRTLVREYELDEGAGKLTELWSHNPGVLADTNGDAWRLSNGNTLHTIGSSGHIKEVTSDNVEVWHVDFHGQHLLGRGEFIEDLYALVSP
jgi:hypothetical protein